MLVSPVVRSTRICSGGAGSTTLQRDFPRDRMVPMVTRTAQLTPRKATRPSPRRSSSSAYSFAIITLGSRRSTKSTPTPTAPHPCAIIDPLTAYIRLFSHLDCMASCKQLRDLVREANGLISGQVPKVKGGEVFNEDAQLLQARTLSQLCSECGSYVNRSHLRSIRREFGDTWLSSTTGSTVSLIATMLQ